MWTRSSTESCGMWSRSSTGMCGMYTRSTGRKHNCTRSGMLSKSFRSLPKYI